jgi:hypothetical protein
MEFSYSQTENFEMEKLSSDAGYFKKPVEINRGYETLEAVIALCSSYFYPQHLTSIPNKIDKLIFNYNQVVNFQNKVTTSNMYTQLQLTFYKAQRVILGA